MKHYDLSPETKLGQIAAECFMMKQFLASHCFTSEQNLSLS